jgi:hypothetical protein
MVCEAGFIDHCNWEPDVPMMRVARSLGRAAAFAALPHPLTPPATTCDPTPPSDGGPRPSGSSGDPGTPAVTATPPIM